MSQGRRVPRLVKAYILDRLLFVLVVLFFVGTIWIDNHFDLIIRTLQLWFAFCNATSGGA
jgi:hypothetical protein